MKGWFFQPFLLYLDIEKIRVMSFYDKRDEERKQAVKLKKALLVDVPKDLAYLSMFNTLKLAVMEKVEEDIKSGKINPEDSKQLFTIRDKNDVFGFTERYLNVMMYYAYKEGMEQSRKNFENETQNMKNTINEIKIVLDNYNFLED